MFTKIKNLILHFLFPQYCIGCGTEKEILCEECLEKIFYPNFSQPKKTFVAAHYNDPVVKKAIWLLKYKGAKELAKPLAKLIHRRIFNGPNFPITNRCNEWILIPAPISKGRLRQRGFNQSELIARSLSDIINSEERTMSVRVETKVLYRKAERPTQVSIKDKKERLENLKDIFAVKNPHLLKNKNIIFIDDVSTTGATIYESIKVLKKTKPKKVISIVVAKGG